MKHINWFWNGNLSFEVPLAQKVVRPHPGLLPQEKVYTVLFLLAFCCLFSAGAQTASPVPVINGFSPKFGQIGTAVTIKGANFSSVAANNIVYFGPVKAVVTAASGTNLTVSVPAGATFAPITETVNSLTAYSPQPFNPGFLGNGGNLATNSFSAPLALNAPATQTAVAVADLDGDGRPDLITANDTDNSISIYQNISSNSVIGTNTFAAPLTIALGVEVSGVAVGDLDGDGRLDLVVCSPTGVIFILQNSSANGVISFTNVFSLAAPDNAQMSLIRDIDGDGKPDILIAGYGDSVVEIYRNTNTNSLLSETSFAAPVDFSTPVGAFTLALGDLNGDGKPDLVTGNGVSVSIFRNTATPGVINAGSFAAPVNLTQPAAGVALADIDGDGLLDLITADQNNETITIFHNTTTAFNNVTFALGVPFATGFSAYWVAVGDLNGDGLPDLVAASEYGTSLAVFQNAATPGNIVTNSLEPAVILNGGGGPHEVVLADLVGDGRMDIVANNLSSAFLTIIQNGAPFAGSPTITLQPTNQVAALGENATFTVVAIGSTDLSYQWSFDGTNILGATLTTLQIANAQLTNIGTYFVTVSNAYGTVTSSNVTLNMPPVIISPPVSITNNYGSTAVFTVTAGGSLPLYYQWLFNGTNLLGQTNATLTLPDIQTNAAGIYSVAVSNMYGGVISSGATLTVLGIPVIVTQPAGQTVKPGNPATFSVVASGAAVLQYQWYFDNNAIVGATNTVYTLNNVQLANAGIYSVVVSNEFGSVSSSNATLTVNGIPVITSFSPGFATNGATVVISGINFDPTPTNNIVYFGAVRAVVLAASPTNMVVTVPAGSTYAPITETVLGLTAFSSKLFLPTFPSAGMLGTSSFGPQITLAAGNGPAVVVSGDLDGDGKPDVVVANVYDGTVYIYRNICTNGQLTAASFEPPVIFTIGGGGDSVWGVALADLDGDGRLDIIVANRNLNIVSIFQNLSSPGSLTTNSFAARVDLPVLGSPRGLAVIDLDGDGHPEIATANEASSMVSVLRNLGQPGLITTNSFALPVEFAAGASLVSVVAADIDGDGKPDLIGVGTAANSTLSVLRNTSTLGNISFAPELNFAGPGGGGYSVAVGDLDGDGKLDLVYAAESSDVLSIYQNTSTPGNISFALPVNLPTSGWANTVAVADLDGDGRPDLVVGTQGPDNLSIFRNTSTPGILTTSSFGIRIDLASGANVNGIAIDDFDGDGRPDIAFGNDYSKTISFYQNAISFATPPVITTQPFNQVVLFGENANFSVAATGTSPLLYQWSFDGTNIVGATNAVLNLNPVLLTSSGLYSVTVSNSFGSANSSNAVLTVTSPPPCDPPPTGLVAWWRAESNANDSIGGNNGIPVGNLDYTDGEVGQAFVFDGSTSYIPLPASVSLNLGIFGGFTIECWIKPNYPEGAAMPIVEWDSATVSGLTLFAESSHTLYGAILDSSNNLYSLRSANDTLSANVWQHVAYTYDKRSGAALLYIDGIIVATNNFGAITPQTMYPMNIGRRTAAVIGNGLTYDGLLDELSLYDRALSENEIAAIYNSGSGGKCDAQSPLIIVQPTNQTVKVGTQTNFAVIAVGTQPLCYQWSFDGTNVGGATNAVLNFNPALLTSAGTYSVTVSNLFGSVDSSNGVLTVYAQDHFAWGNVLSPRFLNVPFTVTIQAQNVSNGIVTNFIGTVLLSSTNGVRVNPPVSGNFSNGLWTGSVIISQLITNLVLRADDGFGEFGLANSIDIVSQPALTASVSGDSLVIYWPAAVPKFMLETSPSLAPANWTQVAITPLLVGGNQYLLSIPISQTNSFYRLQYFGP